jgi:hypothetical protein
MSLCGCIMASPQLTRPAKGRDITDIHPELQSKEIFYEYTGPKQPRPFHRDRNHYRHPGILYTDGIKFLAENAD